METQLIILLISGVFIILGVYLWQRGRHLLKNGKKAEAIVFKNNFHVSRSDDGGTYYPVVRFLTNEQIWITQELSIGYSPAKPEGTKLQVIYDPEDPTNVEINSIFQSEILPRIFVVLGAIGFIFGVVEFLDISHFLPPK